MPTLTCKMCGHQFAVPADLVGMRTQCPVCQVQVWVEPPPRAKPVPPRARVVKPGGQKALLVAGVIVGSVLMLLAGGLVLLATAGPVPRSEGERWDEEQVAAYLKKKGAIDGYEWVTDPPRGGIPEYRWLKCNVTYKGEKHAIRIKREYSREDADKYASYSDRSFAWGRFIISVDGGNRSDPAALEPARRVLR